MTLIDLPCLVLCKSIFSATGNKERSRLFDDASRDFRDQRKWQVAVFRDGIPEHERRRVGTTHLRRQLPQRNRRGRTRRKMDRWGRERVSAVVLMVETSEWEGLRILNSGMDGIPSSLKAGQTFILCISENSRLLLSSDKSNVVSTSIEKLPLNLPR